MKIIFLTLILFSCVNHVPLQKGGDKDLEDLARLTNLEISPLDVYLKNNACQFSEQIVYKNGDYENGAFKAVNPTFLNADKLPIKQFCQPTSIKGTRKVVLITSDGVRSNEIFLGVDYSIQDFNRMDQINTLAALIPNLKSSDFKWRGNHFGLQKDSQKYGVQIQALWTVLNQNSANHLFDTCTIGNPVGLSLPGYVDFLSGIRQKNVESNAVPNALPSDANKHLNYPTLADRLVNAKVLRSDEINMFASWSSVESALSQNKVIPFPSNANFDLATMTKGYDYWEPQKNIPAEIKPYIANEISFFASGTTRYDKLTHSLIKDFIQNKISKPETVLAEGQKPLVPRFLFFGYGDTDESGHRGDYTGYLNALNKYNDFVKEVIDTLEANDYYKGQTTYILTTDHGRGEVGMWSQHTTIKIKDITPFSGTEYIWTATKQDTLPGTSAIIDTWEKSPCNHFQITRLILALLGGRY